MTPAINTLKKQSISHKVHPDKHDPKSEAYGIEAAEKLDIPVEKVFKTLVASIDSQELVVAIIPVAEQRNMKKLAKAAGAKKAEMADKNKVVKTTGYILGGVSPVGQKKRLRTFVNDSATDKETSFVSGGKRGLEIEISPTDLAAVTSGSFATIC